MTTPWRWLARGEPELPDESRWLAPGEAERAAGMRFTKRRTEYLLRRWAGKHAVAAAAGLPLELPQLARIEIANHPGGAPYALVDGERSPFGISLTDRAGWAVCLVGAGPARIGCDLELVQARSAGFGRDFLTEDEQAYVAAQPTAADADAATTVLWSAKESALKVLATGLSRDTRRVPVVVTAARPADGWGRLTINADRASLTGWWRREGSFVLTVAADRPDGPPAALPRSARLSAATPVHSWTGRPVSRPS